MAIDVVTSASFVPASEILSQTVEAILEIVVSANDVLFKKDSFKKLASYLERIVPVLKELKGKCFSNSESLNNAIQIINREIKAAKQLTVECSTKSKVYLLMNSRGIVRRLEGTMREISRGLSLLPLASLELSSAIVVEIGNLCDSMQKAEFKAAITEEEILEKIETGIQERNADRSYANNLLVLIAEAVGIPTERSALKREFEDFKSEIENVRLRKDKAEAIQMDQIIAFQPLEPLQSFYCPITRDVMVDPVETSSGQTFERSAIEKWFTEGNNLCPLTMTPLDTSILRPNKTLRQSIEEWKDRNTMITIASMKPNLTSGDEEEVLQCLGQLKDLCEQRDMHREWVILENYISVLIQLLGGKNRDIKNRVLVILHILTKDSDDAKDRVAKVDGAIELVVRSLGRRTDERRLAVALLLDLSKYNVLRDSIGKVQGCILLLVTMASGDDYQAARDAEEILENLSYSDQNVIQMARANYFKHLLQRLSTGPDAVKLTMATAIAEMELTDHNKVVLLERGALRPLLNWVSHGGIQMKSVAVKALRNLSSVPKNGLQMIKEGASRPLLDLLHLGSSSSALREQVAATVMHLAVSTMSQESTETAVSLLESDEDVFMVFSLINLTGPEIQQNLLQIFQALCQSPSAAYIKTKLTQCSAIQVLIQLCERDIGNVRLNAVKLFCFLVKDGDEATILEHVRQKCIETLLRIIQSFNDDEEVASAVGIIANLPENDQITQWLVDAGAIPIIFHFLRSGRLNDSNRSQLVESAVGAICRFTAPTNLEWQKRAAEADVIPMLVQLLDSGTTLTKYHAATSLSRFSRSSLQLSRTIPKKKGFWCLSAPPETACPVHGGICSVESSFCLLEADAVIPLARVLQETDAGVCEASLDALLTLIEGERLQNGSKVLAEANAITPMIRCLSSPSLRLQEKALHALERIFRLPEFKQKYGPAAQMPLVDLTQRGNSSMKSLSARILAHLNVLHDQSSYF
ncbi:U-box domain-containing protein 44-like [Gossypium australe]|uniref:RING-type E3 ubiquitin transferase n=1 Tax=Gossypium australe TaxID=47621 RepID=A0A5B6UQW8_9ROSI|nr:U-box domain-containing protein 44-like [Gossypium australe]